MGFAEVLGLTGAGLYLFTYVQLQLKRDYAKTFMYSFLNFLGAAFVATSLLFSWNSASMVIQIMWIGISLYGMYRCMRHAHPEKVEKLENVADALVPDAISDAVESVTDAVIDVTPGPPPKPKMTKAKKRHKS